MYQHPKSPVFRVRVLVVRKMGSRNKLLNSATAMKFAQVVREKVTNPSDSPSEIFSKVPEMSSAANFE